jgi:hypothetical protein
MQIIVHMASKRAGKQTPRENEEFCRAFSSGRDKSLQLWRLSFYIVRRRKITNGGSFIVQARTKGWDAGAH